MLDARFNSSVNNIVSTVGKLALADEHSAAIAKANQAAEEAHAARKIAPIPQSTTPVTASSHCSLCGRLCVSAESDRASTMGAAIGAFKSLSFKAANTAILKEVHSCYGCRAVMNELADATLLPAFVRAGQAKDHRSNGVSSYPPPINALIRADLHAQRNAAARKNKQAEKKTQKALEEAAAPAADAGDDDGDDGPALDAEALEVASNSAAAAAAIAAAHPPRPPHTHQGLQLQSREDMKHAIDEFLLPEGQ